MHHEAEYDSFTPSESIEGIEIGVQESSIHAGAIIPNPQERLADMSATRTV